VALALRLITRGAPALPPAMLPITTPPWLTWLPLTPIWPAPLPSLRTDSASLAPAPLVKYTHRLPPARLALADT
jgi:hypothetical protein